MKTWTDLPSVMFEICSAEMVILSNSVSLLDSKYQTYGLVNFGIVLSVAEVRGQNSSHLVVYQILLLHKERRIQGNFVLLSL